MPTDAATFAAAAIGKPWCKDAMGPDAYSCWGLARAIERDVFGRDLPIINTGEMSALAIARAMRGHPIMKIWPDVPKGKHRHGDLVLMDSPSSPGHVGVYLDVDRGNILHCIEGAGVRFDQLAMVHVMGWQNLTYYRPAAEHP